MRKSSEAERRYSGGSFGAPLALACLALFLLASGCNLFGALDSPSSDAQKISAGRACVDRGDFDCAFKYYTSVSGDGLDQAYTDMAFTTLAQNGAEIGDFSNAFSGGVSAGVGITQLAGRYAPRSGESMRLGIYSAFLYAQRIGNPELRGLVRFVTSTALVAELLAEDSGTLDAEIRKSDIVRDPGACARINESQCFNSVACSKPDGKNLVSGDKVTNLETATRSEIAGAPTFHLMAAALQHIRVALNQELAMTGTLSGSAADFSQTLLSPSYVTMDQYLPIDPSREVDSPCFRYALITNDVGLE